MYAPAASQSRTAPTPKKQRGRFAAMKLCCLLGLLDANSLLAATVVWTGTDATNFVNTNWCDANNWSGGLPAKANSVYFFDRGAAGSSGAINNIVDTNSPILFLQY